MKEEKVFGIFTLIIFGIPTGIVMWSLDIGLLIKHRLSSRLY